MYIVEKKLIIKIIIRFYNNNLDIRLVRKCKSYNELY